MPNIPPIEFASYDEKEIYNEIAEFHGGVIGDWVRLCHTFRIIVSPELLAQVLGTDDVWGTVMAMAEAVVAEVDPLLRAEWEEDPLGGMLLADDYRMPEELPIDVCLRVAVHFTTTQDIEIVSDEETVAIYVFMNLYSSAMVLEEGHFVLHEIREMHWIVLTENNRHRPEFARAMLIALLGELGWETIMVKCLARLGFAFDFSMFASLQRHQRVPSPWTPLLFLYQLSATPEMVIASYNDPSDRERRMIQFFGYDPQLSEEAIFHLTRIFSMYMDTNVEVIRVFPHPTEVEVLVLEGRRRVSKAILYNTYFREFPDLFRIQYRRNNQIVVTSRVRHWKQLLLQLQVLQAMNASR